ncbi:hypothetical protein TNIN_91091 [Trichonephila inaurata madagascariensis]|uniref:Uncharacterized protein n=1 Tax=Trichonephila inaurata madagascariensis TaxID=2747483 RepID=A0A8X6YWK2_9ARAC|nr:hypothetical protein TNIN_91091 [Trichonephila inaurata madagascariensis]
MSEDGSRTFFIDWVIIVQRLGYAWDRDFMSHPPLLSSGNRGGRKDSSGTGNFMVRSWRRKFPFRQRWDSRGLIRWKIFFRFLHKILSSILRKGYIFDSLSRTN